MRWRFPGLGAGDANLDIGDSAIMETCGLGAMAMAASPPALQIVGAKAFGDAIATTRRVAEICVGANPTFPIAALGGEGTPTAIDIRKVVATGITPVMNTAIAHRDMKVGRMIGAGIATAPLAPFAAALAVFVETYAR